MTPHRPSQIEIGILAGVTDHVLREVPIMKKILEEMHK